MTLMNPLHHKRLLLPTILTFLTMLLGFWIAVFAPEFSWVKDVYEHSAIAARAYGIILLNVALVVGILLRNYQAWLYRLIPLIFHMVWFVIGTIIQLDIQQIPTVIIYIICIILIYSLDIFGNTDNSRFEVESDMDKP